MIHHPKKISMKSDLSGFTPNVLASFAITLLLLTSSYLAMEMETIEEKFRYVSQTTRVPIIMNKTSVRDSIDNSNSGDCRLMKKGEGPLPLILISLGRSGSSVLWGTMSHLTGLRNVAWEYTGGNLNSSREFFHNLKADPKLGYDWPIKKLCKIQRRESVQSPINGIVGFQWKPYFSSFDHEYAIEGLKAIASHQNPIIRIVYLRRNALDRKISNIRHDRSKIGDGEAISAHCEIGDTACINKHSKYDNAITFPTGSKLMQWLQTDANHEYKIRKRLSDLNVKFVEVTYERLFNSEDAKEWMRIFQFLGVGPTQNLTIDDVRSSFAMASTHTKSRKETIINFEDVEKTLSGTKFEYLLIE